MLYYLNQQRNTSYFKSYYKKNLSIKYSINCSIQLYKKNILRINHILLDNY